MQCIQPHIQPRPLWSTEAADMIALCEKPGFFSWKEDVVLESRLHCSSRVARKSTGRLPSYSLKRQPLSILYVLSPVSYSLLFAMHTKWAPRLREKIRGTIHVWELYGPDPLHLDNEGKKLKPYLSGPNVIWHFVWNVVKPNPNGTRANS